MAITQVTNNLIHTNTIPRNKLAFSSLIGEGGAFRNKLINGAMEIDQRNEGSANTINNSASYIADRWYGGAVGGANTGTASVQNVTDAPTNFRKSIKYTVTGTKSVLAGSDYFGIWQNIEGTYIGDLYYGSSSAQTTTLSFWVKSSVAGTYSGRIYAAGSPGRVYIFTYTVNSVNTWEFKTITVSGNTTTSLTTNNNLGMQIFFSLGHGTNHDTTNTNVWQSGALLGTPNSVKLISTLGATFQITGVQLEIGSSVTSFESLPSSMELQRCQRYFCKSYAPGTVPGTATTTGMIAAVSEAIAGIAPTNVTFPVPMRDVPALYKLVLYNPYATNATNTTATLGGSTQLNINYAAATVSDNMKPQRDENGIGEVQPTGASVLANAVYVFHYTAESEI